MKLAVLSGKGGTGKTLLSVNLAELMPNSLYIDCDVEAPNGRIFFKPTIESTQPVTVSKPVIDGDLCNGCRRCTDFCRFNALAFINNKVKVFEDVCHSCGGCQWLCPEGAITEISKTIGIIEHGKSLETSVVTGVMNIGEASGVPIIEALNKIGNDHPGHVVIDCPPGSACVVMESIKDADYCLIVAEPTIFGIHNMKMVHELTRQMGKPRGLVINKSYGDDRALMDYCEAEGLALIGTIPYHSDLASIGSRGEIAIRQSKTYQNLFLDILRKLKEELAHEAVADLKW